MSNRIRCQSHGNPLDYVKKSNTMTWLVCRACKQPVGWLESTDAELRAQIPDEELQKYV